MRDHKMESDSEFSGAGMLKGRRRVGCGVKDENGSCSDHVLHLLHQLATCGSENKKRGDEMLEGRSEERSDENLLSISPSLSLSPSIYDHRLPTSSTCYDSCSLLASQSYLRPQILNSNHQFKFSNFHFHCNRNCHKLFNFHHEGTSPQNFSFLFPHQDPSPTHFAGCYNS